MKKKPWLIVLIGVLVLPLLLFTGISLFLHDPPTNGFAGTFGIVRLTFSDADWVQIDSDPPQYLFKNDESMPDRNAVFTLIRSLADEFDESENSGNYELNGYFRKDDIRYHYYTGAFTSHYLVLRIKRV